MLMIAAQGANLKIHVTVLCVFTGWKTEFYLSQNSSIFYNKKHFLSIIFHHEIV